MRILFIDNFPVNFGASYLTAILRQGGHDIHLLNYPLDKWKDPLMYQRPEDYYPLDTISEEALNWAPDVIAFSVFSANFMFYKRTAEAIRRKSNLPILVGGVLPTLKPDLFMENSLCDFVFRGEAEPFILDLVEKIQLGTFHDVPNLVYRGTDGEVVYNDRKLLEEDLNSLPFCDKEFYPSDTTTLPMLTSRGCVLDCSFCSAGKYSRLNVGKGESIVRKRSVDNVIAEIKQALEKKSYKDIYFFDDFFITNSRWMSEFAEKYTKEINLPYDCFAFPATVTSKIAELLKNSGCRTVCMGFQTANNEYKATVLTRRETKEQVTKAKEILERHGLMFTLDHIFNLPGETREHIKEALDYYIDNNVKALTIFFLNYYPDSALTKYSKDNGFLNPDQYDKIMKNEMLGEQSYRGTVTDPKKSDLQIQYAFLFRLIFLLPGTWVKWFFDKDIHLFFPTNRISYYGISILSNLRGRGGLSKSIDYLLFTLRTSFPQSKNSKSKTFSLRPTLEKVFKEEIPS